MGEYKSSITRVWPVFDCLLRHDATGMTWMPTVLRLGSQAAKSDQNIASNPGRLLPELAHFKEPPGPVKKALGLARIARISGIRGAYEAEVPPSVEFLAWALGNPTRLTWPQIRKPGEKTRECTFSPQTHSAHRAAQQV